MPKLVILGSSNAIPDDSHENTHMALAGGESSVLIDCPGNPLVRLRRAGLDVNALTDLVLTHFHPDHVSGFSLLLMNLWLLGRKRLLAVHGLDYTVDRLEQVMELHGWSRWPNFFPVTFRRLPELEMTPVIESEEWRIFSSPVSHLIPTIGLRIEFSQSQHALAYSCDTEPCDQVVRLAQGAEVLIHESAGASRGHTDAFQAGEIARKAEAQRLILIHYPTGEFKDGSLVARAAEAFDGPVTLAEDFMELEF